MSDLEGITLMVVMAPALFLRRVLEPFWPIVHYTAEGGLGELPAYILAGLFMWAIGIFGVVKGILWAVS